MLLIGSSLGPYLTCLPVSCSRELLFCNPMPENYGYEYHDVFGDRDVKLLFFTNSPLLNNISRIKEELLLRGVLFFYMQSSFVFPSDRILSLNSHESSLNKVRPNYTCRKYHKKSFTQKRNQFISGKLSN